MNCCFILFLQTILKWNDLVAQLVEQYTFNVWVLGSSPSQITEKTLQQCKVFFYEFIDAASTITADVFHGERFLRPIIRVSHPIK